MSLKPDFCACERLKRVVVGRMLAGGDIQEQASKEMKNNIAIFNDKT